MSELTVVMCTWKKPERLDKTIDMLRNSTVNTHLFIWNNNTDICDTVDKIVQSRENDIDIDVYRHSSENVAGMGRFYCCRGLICNGYDGPFAFIDDDQEFGPEFFEELLSDYRAAKEDSDRVIVAQYAHQYDGEDYWYDRVSVARGEEAIYCGTGGMIADDRVFNIDSKVFEFPRPNHYTMEDMWLSFVAKHCYGYTLIKGYDECIHQVPSKKKTHPKFRKEKKELFRELRDGKYL